MTPRKAQRHRHNHSQSHLQQSIQASDYDSEAPYTAPENVPVRSNSELNLTVLQRYNPSITSILSIAASCQIYNYFPADGTWDKAEIAGTLFVCTLAPFSATTVGGQERYCVVLLNKKGLDNLIIDMQDVQEVELKDEFMIIRFLERGQAGLSGPLEEEKVLGFFIHADQADTREVNCTLVKGLWERVKDGAVIEALERGTLEMGGSEKFEEAGFESGSASGGVLTGRRLSLKDLFGAQPVR
jgi:hypothetical protein